MSLLSFPALAQNHHPIQCQGQIPEDFLELSSEKYKNESATIETKSRAERKTKEEFYLESNFIIDGLLRSGKVLFNDPISDYINSIADIILKDDPELRKELRFYTVKSPYVNAFATNSGIIFVNMGLLGQVENEAQLAYILSHEIIHYKNQHAINAYVESVELTKAARKFQISFNDALLARSNYSQDLEMESDKEGLELYLKTDYDPSTVEDVFFVLEFSHLPFDEVEYERQFLETPYVKLPDDYYLDEVSEIESSDEDRSEYSTHPNCSERRSKLVPMLRNASDEGKSRYLLGEERFNKMRRTARYEMTRYHVSERQYGAALYNAFLLLNDDSTDFYAQKTYLNALNYLVKYKNRDYTYGVLRSYHYVQGESQQLNHLLYKVEPEELNTIALVKAWDLLKQNPNDKQVQKIVNELTYELTYHHNSDIRKYHKLPSEEAEEEEPEVDEKKLSKYDKIKKKIGREDYDNDSTNVLYAFHQLIDDTAFIGRFDRIAIKAGEDKDDEDESLESWKLERKEKKKLEDKGKSLGIDNILMLDPRYYKVKEGTGSSLKFQKTEQAQLNFISQLKETAKSADLNIEVLSPLSMKENEINRFNDYATLSEWARERYEHTGTLPDKVLPSSSEYADSLIKAYGTRYLAVTRVVNIHDKDPQKYLTACLCCAGVYTAPLGVYILLKRDMTTEIRFDLLDLKTGKFIMEVDDTFKSKDHKYLVKSKYYHIFNQIKRGS